MLSLLLLHQRDQLQRLRVLRGLLDGGASPGKVLLPCCHLTLQHPCGLWVHYSLGASEALRLRRLLLGLRIRGAAPQHQRHEAVVLIQLRLCHNGLGYHRSQACLHACQWHVLRCSVFPFDRISMLRPHMAAFSPGSGICIAFSCL